MTASRLPTPRVRDAQGWTWELYWFLRKRYRVWACPSWRREPCGCEDCSFDTSVNRVWQTRLPVTEPGRKNEERVVLGSYGYVDGNRWVPGRAP